MMERGRGAGVIADFLRKAICQAGKSTHAHSHREVLAFDAGRSDFLLIWLTADDSRVVPRHTARDVGLAQSDLSHCRRFD